MIDREVEEPLDLAGVEIDGDDAIGPGSREAVGNQLRGDRLPGQGLLVLPRIAVVRDHCRDALRRRALERIDHDQLLHDRLVHGGPMRLDDVRVGASGALRRSDVDLA